MNWNCWYSILGERVNECRQSVYLECFRVHVIYHTGLFEAHWVAQFIYVLNAQEYCSPDSGSVPEIVVSGPKLACSQREP